MIEKVKVKLDRNDVQGSKDTLLRLNNMYSQWTDTDAQITSDVGDAIWSMMTVEGMIPIFDQYWKDYVELEMI
tara:strand:- start:786 stop:1004 length:219 start_codon:yes stop_codon:yes gene_type:complete